MSDAPNDPDHDQWKPRPKRATPPSERAGYVPAPGGQGTPPPVSQIPPRVSRSETGFAGGGKEAGEQEPISKPAPASAPQAEPSIAERIAANSASAAKPVVEQPQQPQLQGQSAPGSQRPAAKKRKSRTGGSLVARMFFGFAIGVFLLFFVGVIGGAAAYITLSADIPDPNQLEARQSTFASTKVYDSKGNLLVELTDPTNPVAGRRTYVPLSQISDWVKKATLATEDPNFYRYSVGFDPIAIIRAVYYAVTERDVVSGGSTITQQVARNLLLSPEERTSRSPLRKIREIILANELTRRYPREKILEIYLNEINYANLAYGIEAAAQTYFNKPAKDLNLAEASMLAGIPQSPVLWDPVANKDNTLRRQRTVLGLMQEQDHITADQIFAAQQEIKDKTFTAPPANYSAVAPHFMQYVQQQLDAEYGANGLYRDGLRVYTTLDQDVQKIAESAIREQISKLADKNVTNGAAVVMDPKTGQIKAMAGSADFNNEAIDGQVNVALAYRQPGSSVKPFTYLAAMERGWTPATLFWDKPITFTNEYGQVYAPRNYDGKFHGPMLMREALGRSMNTTAVETLNFVGVPSLLELSQRVGLNFPPNPQYGLAITLGGAEARLLDLTDAYATLANGGVRLPPTAITRVERADGTLLRDYAQTQGAGQQVIRPEHAWLITSILSDNAARAKSFGANSVLKLSRPAAVKTGTTNDFRDNLTVGYTPDLVTGVWVGNSDNSEMEGVSGVTGAAPIWAQIMEQASANLPAKDFAPPQGVVAAEICALGGHAPSPTCPAKRVEYFKSDQLPLPADENLEKAVAAGDPNFANTQQPTPNPQSPDILITEPSLNGLTPRGQISIRGTVNPPGFQQYVVEYGDGENPGEWKWVSGPHLSPVINDQLTTWSIESLPAGRYTLRVTVNTSGGQLVGYGRFDVGP